MSEVEKAKAHFFAALELLDAHDYAAAEHQLRAALAIVPDRVSALSNLAVAEFRQGKVDQAMATARLALELAPDDFEARIVLGSSHGRRGAFSEALREYEKAVAAAPMHPRGYLARGRAHVELKQLAAALADYRDALRLAPGDLELVAELLWAQLLACDWRGVEPAIATLLAAVRAGAAQVSPFQVLAMASDPADQLAAARQFCALNFPETPPLYRGAERPAGERLRVAYISNDFRDHPVAHLMVGVLERHDRERFEIFCVSLGPADGSALRQRCVAACDHFFDARAHSDAAVAEYIKEQGIDVAVDLGGHTTGARSHILALGAAPVQASYLGYPGTMGAAFVDYVVADPIVIPAGTESLYSEAVVRLPDSYCPADDRRSIAADTPSRNAMGLRDDAFVFCCFSNTYKIRPEMFDAWMDILRAVPASQLWLATGNDLSRQNLRSEAMDRGIDQGRLVFASYAPSVDQHLARHRLADLSLDTLPYNAHTTAADALWAGLPIITCEGKAFAGRVASSLLRAIGLPELVTTNLDDFRALAVALATDRDRLAAIKAKLAANRDTMPLFDTARTTRHLEAAYTEMVARHRRGEKPAAFNVAPVR